MIQVSKSPYLLSPLSGAKPRSGDLLRYEFEDGVGYADFFTWPELGDSPADEQFENLRTGLSTDLLDACYRMAFVDAKGRKSKSNLFKNALEADFPKNHFLIADFANCQPKTILTALEKGFSSFKVKLNGETEIDIKNLNFLNSFLTNKIKIRLDFNMAFSNQISFWKFLYKLPSCIVEKIDYIEDPFPFVEKSWEETYQKFGISLALDRNIDNKSAAEGAQVLIYKPSIQKREDIFESSIKKISVTSYLGHPLGQLWALYEALQLKKECPEKLVDCGLLSHLAYEPSIFSNQLTVVDNVLLGAEGPGLGMGDSLQNLCWEKVAEL